MSTPDPQPKVRLIRVAEGDGAVYGALVPVDYHLSDLDGYGMRCSPWVWEQIEALVAAQAPTKQPATDRRAVVLQAIADDAAADATAFESRPFTGKVVAEYLGNQGAAIAQLARIVATLLPGGQS